MRIAIGVICGLILVAVVFDFVRDFYKEKGTFGERLLAAGKGTATILWARICYVLASITGILTVIPDYYNAPGVSDAIRQILKPEHVVFISLGIALITEIARRRSLTLPDVPAPPTLPPLK